MKTIKLILILVLLAFFIAGMLTSCSYYTCPTYAKGITGQQGSKL